MQQQKKVNNTGNFISYFNSRVLPVTKNIETIRSKIITGAIVWAVFVLIILFLVFINKISLKNPVNETNLYLILNSIVLFIVFVVAPLLNLKCIYGMFAKEKIVPALLAFCGRFTYVPPMNIASAIYKAIKNKTGIGGFFSELFKDKKTNISVNPSILARLFKFDDISYDDKIIGIHNDVNIEFSELETSYTARRTDNDGKTSRTKFTTFKGLVFSAKMNKNFKGITLLSFDNIDKRRAIHPVIDVKSIGSMDLTDALSFGKQIADIAGAIKDIAGTVQNMKDKSPEEIETAFEQKYGANSDDINKQQKLQDIHLEDPLFNRKFKICSTDQIEARYIFTTAFMDRFMKIAAAFNYRLHAIFIKNNVYIFIDSRYGFQIKQKNWFEIPFFKSCSDPVNYKEFLNDFSKLLGIVETLKLNQNIGM